MFSNLHPIYYKNDTVKTLSCKGLGFYLQNNLQMAVDLID